MKNNILSANTLFHFTKSFEILESILINEFYPRYCLEDHTMFVPSDQSYFYSYIKSYFERAIPMVCFCDIPLSQIDGHSDIYGKYAIGLSKDWGKKKGLNPVWYAVDESKAVGYLKKMLVSLIDNYHKTHTTEIEDEIQKISSQLNAFLFYTKPNEGFIKKQNGESAEKRFYDEREWRYVPDIDDMEKYLFAAMPKSDFENKIKNDEANERIKKSKLSFEPDDIKYIIVKSDDEILKMAKRIKQIKAKYDFDTKELLTTKIVSMKQISEDF